MHSSKRILSSDPGVRPRTPKETNQLVEIVLRHVPSILLALAILVAALRVPEICMSSLAVAATVSKIRCLLVSGFHKNIE